MVDVSNRTFVSSILFLDIIEYSKRSVTEQLILKQRFNELLTGVLQYVAPTERIILDTGDGAAISFQGNPEEALFAAMALRDAIAAESPERLPLLEVRSGINLGPIRLIRDLNGQMNIIGDGINVAQRVMSFSSPGEILVSRSYYEVVSRLSDDYYRVFQEAGTRTDKHVREHEVYTIGDSADHLPAPHARAAAKAGSQSKAKAKDARGSAGANKSVMIGMAALFVLIAAIGGLLLLKKPDVPAVAAEAPDASAGAERTPAKPEKTSIAATKPQARAEAHAASGTPKQTEDAAKKKPEPAAKGGVELAILPWGEVYVNGVKRGVSPPMKSLPLAPGSYQIEVRNTEFPAYVETVNVKAGEMVRLRHKF